MSTKLFMEGVDTITPPGSTAEKEREILDLKGTVADLQALQADMKEKLKSRESEISSLVDEMQRLRLELYDFKRAEETQSKKRALAKKKRKQRRPKKVKGFHAAKFSDDKGKAAAKKREKWEKENAKAEQLLAQVTGASEASSSTTGQPAVHSMLVSQHEGEEGSDVEDEVIDLDNVAEHFPNISLAAVLQFEKNFLEADADRSGLIDANELQHVLNSTGISEKAVQELVKSLNLDVEAGLDFIDCLTIFTTYEKQQQQTAAIPSAPKQPTHAQPETDNPTQSKACAVM
jgi:hypothetical protein